MKKRTLLFALLSAIYAPCALAQANNKPVRIIVAFAPGGPVDAMARTIAEPLGKSLGRTVIVENKPGASGAIGAGEVLKSEADGSVIWLTSVGAAAINPALFPKLTYNMQKDFTPISLVANNVEVFVAHEKNPAKDAKEFIANAKAKKEPTPIGSSGKGSIPHLALVQLEQSTGADLLHVPFNGMAPALNNLLGGQVDGFFADVPAVMAQIKGGRVKALGMASKTRHPLLPDVKTFEEQGFTSVDTNNWYGMFASAKTSPEVIKQLNRAVQQAVADPAAHAKMTQSGAEPKSSSPEEMGAMLKADTEKWAQVIKARNITGDE
ncbi:Bug family tripartite tricarboxylate transporter substrate binding protein [Limnohabitans sp. DCL3]|uniref:Bug family tripartite tricarboxylate transporter substrate binding protein n=1 Tax=Limnohabitans sp. DCL3 TaxID=3374103 RepID=UPI003A8A70FA